MGRPEEPFAVVSEQEREAVQVGAQALEVIAAAADEAMQRPREHLAVVAEPVA